MRRKIFGFAIAAVILFTSATNWDGAATVDSAGNLTPESFSIATNAFPSNTIVDVTNLENDKTVTVIVASRLPDSGLIATLSRSAAEALGFNGDFVHRIRMVETSHAHASSFSPEEEPIEAEPVREIVSVTETKVEEHFLPDESVDTTLILVPSDERIPEGPVTEIASEDIVPPIEEDFAPEEVVITEIQPPVTTVSETLPDLTAAPFTTELEQGWYVQIAAYSRLELANDESSRLGMTYPLVIQRVDTDTTTLFRVLLGPLNQGESGAMLQRVKSIGYKDAFVRNSQRN